MKWRGFFRVAVWALFRERRVGVDGGINTEVTEDTERTEGFICEERQV